MMPTPPPEAFNVAAVTSLASSLTILLREISRHRHIAITSTDGENADKLVAALPGREFSFEVRGIDAVGRGRKLGGQVNLVKLKERAELHQIWVGCYLRWKKRPAKTFALDTLSWSFFTGRETENILRLRAEWDSDASHPQPHWHFDDETLTTSTDGEIEVQSLCDLHLPMSGWTHSEDYPSCWTHAWPADTDVLVAWSRRTLQVASDQLALYLKRSGV
jgi:hypothetical protein